MSAIPRSQPIRCAAPAHDSSVNSVSPDRKYYRVLRTNENDKLVALVHKNGQEIRVNLFKDDDDKRIVFNGQAALCQSEQEAIEYIFKHFEFYNELQNSELDNR